MTKPQLLVANRAEIASRVFRTCRGLGVETVAVHSDADADLPYVAEADLAVRLPGSAPADTYLRGDLLVDAALRAGADAIHPGYGFLSENAAFARAVIEAGLTGSGRHRSRWSRWARRSRRSGSWRAAGVPVLEVPEEPAEADLPLMVKASAGGGGRGHARRPSLTDLPDAVRAAEAEALSAFGDGTVFVEPYVEHARHVEVQVFGTDCRPRRAGLLAPAAPPEGRRGGAGAGAARGHPRRAAGCRSRGRRRDRLPRGRAPSSSSTTRTPAGSCSWR